MGIKFLLLFVVGVVSIIVGCSGTNSSIQTGTLIEPTVKINPNAGSKFGGTQQIKPLRFKQIYRLNYGILLNLSNSLYQEEVGLLPKRNSV